MKKIASIILSLIILTASFIGCTQEKDKNEDKITVPEEAKFLVGRWERAGGADTMYFSLHKDESFAFYCACGDSVGDADCYDTFEYKKDEQIIRAFDSNDESCYHDYKLYMHGKNFIVIDVDGVMMEFWLENKNQSDIASSATDHCGELMENFTMHRCMTDITDTEITLAPPYYDGDIKEHREEKITMKLAQDVKFSYFYVTTVNKDGEETSEYDQGEMTLEDVKYQLDSNLGEGFIWLNENLEVTRVFFYGETYIWE